MNPTLAVFAVVLNQDKTPRTRKMVDIKTNCRIGEVKSELMEKLAIEHCTDVNQFVLGTRDASPTEYIWFEDEDMIMDSDLLSSLCKRTLVLSEKSLPVSKPIFFTDRYSTEHVKSLLNKSQLDQYSPEERLIRTELAACYRLFDLFGWTDTIYGHLTARVITEEKEHFLINPFGLHYSEITASSLVKVDLQGNIVDGGCTGDLFGINRAGYVIHSAVHEARSDVGCVMHMHFAPCVALSCIENAFSKTLSQTSGIVGDVAYHKAEGIAVNQEERVRLQKDLGSEKKVLILENHGVVTCGETVGEAFLFMFILAEACKIQVQASNLKGGIIPVEESIADKTYQIAHSFTKDGFGRKELCAYMRYLDYQYELNKSSGVPSFRT